MALMVPESISSSASQGEQILYKILREKLPDDFLVWYKQVVESNYIDFLIIAPNFGLLIIQVMTWYPSQINATDINKIKLLNSPEKNKKIELKNSPSYLDIPGRRTRKRSIDIKEEQDTFSVWTNPYQELIDKLLVKLRKYHILTHVNGDNQHKLAFPCNYGLFFSNITAEQAQEKNIDKLLSPSKIIYRNELFHSKSISSDELVNKLIKIFPNTFTFPCLTHEQIDTIKAIIFPEIAIKLVPASLQTVPNCIELKNESYVFKTLDPRQECIVRAIGDGHRIIYGVAGSGKTLILLSHAKLLVKQNPHQKILILCFNRSLAASLKSLMYEYSNQYNSITKIEVFTFYGWVSSLLKKIPAPSGFTTEYYDAILGEILLKQLENTPIKHKYDAILVDEGQTFDPLWFKCCVAALKDPEDGNLMIVADGGQSVYKRNNFTWNSVGVKAVGRTSNKKLKLDKNYRNTQEILAAGWSLFSNLIDEENLTFDIVKPTDAVRHGVNPILHIKTSEIYEVESVINEVKDLARLGYALNDIAILYRMADDQKKALLKSLIQKLQNLGIDTDWVSENRESEKKYNIKNSGIKIINTLGALGLEFKVVLILWVQDWDFSIPPHSESDILTCRRLYVAMTRAQDVLYIFGSGNSKLLQQLQYSGNFTVKQA
ncbi:3'-5' exonuclease [Nostoc sp.]|uniref:3'-5' exonuclease n=1 Tax=Nostoc sp. TaxID=1180 RepID=UPI002FFBEDB6